MNKRTAVKIFKRQKEKYSDESFKESKDFKIWYGDTEQYIKDLCKQNQWFLFFNSRTMDEYHRAIDSCIEYVTNTQPTFTEKEFEMIKWILPAIIASMTTLLSLTLPLILSGNLREHFCTWLQSF